MRTWRPSETLCTTLLVLLLVSCGGGAKEHGAGASGGGKPSVVERLKGALQVGEPTEFAADQVTRDADGAEHVSRLYVKPSKMRLEMTMSREAGQLVSIVREDKGIAWMLMTNSKTYREMDLDDPELAAAIAKIGKDHGSESEELGEETVAGFSCRKVRSHTRATVMGQTFESTSTAWVSKRLGIPVRVENEQSVTELCNVVLGAQPDALFEIPAGYRPGRGLLDLAGTENADQEREGRAQERKRDSHDGSPAQDLRDRFSRSSVGKALGVKTPPARRTQAAAAGAVSFAGSWRSRDFGVLRLQQQASRVWGDYEHNEGQLEGTVSGNRLTFRWWERTAHGGTWDAANPGERGDGYLVLSENGATLKGEWRYDGSEGWDGPWSASRRE